MIGINFQGATRSVILTRRWAIKIPGAWGFRMKWKWRWRSILNGLQSNFQECEFSDAGWPELCPVRFRIPGGFLVVMPRARPLTQEEWEEFDYQVFVTRGDGYAEANLKSRGGSVCGLLMGGAEPEGLLIPAEEKISSFGVLNGRVVAVDYG